MAPAASTPEVTVCNFFKSEVVLKIFSAVNIQIQHPERGKGEHFPWSGGVILRIRARSRSQLLLSFGLYRYRLTCHIHVWYTGCILNTHYGCAKCQFCSISIYMFILCACISRIHTSDRLFDWSQFQILNLVSLVSGQADWPGLPRQICSRISTNIFS